MSVYPEITLTVDPLGLYGTAAGTNEASVRAVPQLKPVYEMMRLSFVNEVVTCVGDVTVHS